MESEVRYRRVSADDACTLELLWERANARRLNAPIPLEPDADSADRLRDRLVAKGAVAVIGENVDGPVACCIAAPLWEHEAARPGAHVSVVAVAPECWGRGFGARIVKFMEHELRPAPCPRNEPPSAVVVRAPRLDPGPRWRPAPRGSTGRLREELCRVTDFGNG